MNDPAPRRDLSHEPTAPGALGDWWRQGARSAFLLRPRWAGLQTTPLLLLCLVAAPCLVVVLMQRLSIPGAASLEWRALLMGWLSTLLLLWICWLCVPRSHDPLDPTGAPSALGLFSMAMAQLFTIDLVAGAISVPLLRHNLFAVEGPGRIALWGLWLMLTAWPVVTISTLAWRAGARRGAPRVRVILALAGLLLLGPWLQATNFWRASRPLQEDPGPEPLAITQELMEAQPRLLAEQLQALRPQRRGVVDVYAITFAPYASEDVFKREGELVADVMQERFGSAGRTLRLVNHRDTAWERPWATPLNLQRAIRRAAALMDRDEDVLFIHLTSHGARGGPLVADLWPLEIDPVTPALLKGWLDEAGVRWRVISVSACYSGSWIAPLSGEETLVMTAADADHTSFGCGRLSPLTFFGRAMFDEQLRQTWSFEQAHAAARVVIAQREQEAHKPGGFSNPQIQVGDKVRAKLAQLEAQRAAAARE